jgi:YebC/PmpR family DNA-binding regulatory protein
MGRKWNNIKEKKGAQDKAKAAVYTRLLRDITKSVKTGGDKPDSNFMLKITIDKCRKSNVPKDLVERAIKKGLGGEDDGYVDVNYEGYGPNGVAIFIEASTNNTTRTAPNIRNCFNKCGGSLGVSGCLQFVFEHKAVFEIPTTLIDEETLTLEVIDAGADNVEIEEDVYVVTGPMESFGGIHKKLEELKISAEESGLERVPSLYKEVDIETFKQIMKLVNMLEEDDDVVKVYHNIQYDESFQDV